MKTLEAPARKQHRVETPRAQTRADLRRVHPGEPVEARLARGIAQEFMLVTGEKIDVPFETDAKPGLRLVL